MVLLSLITVNGTDTEFTYLTIVETVLGGVVVGQLQQQVPAVGQQLPRIIGRVSSLGRPPEGATAPPPPDGPAEHADAGGPARPS